MKGLIFTFALTYGGAVLALFSPFYGLLIYVCFAIIKPEYLWYWSVPTGNYSRIVAIGLLLGWALKGFGNWQLGRARGVIFALLGFWLWMTISAAQAPDQALAWRFVEAQSKVFLPFLVGITTIDSVRKLRQLVWVIVLSQGYVALELNLAYHGGFNRLLEIGFGNVDNNSVAIAMVTVAGLAFFLGLEAPKWWQKLLAFGAVACMVHTVLFAFSRGGMLALIVTAMIAFVLMPKQLKHYVVMVLAVLIGLQLAGKEVRARFTMSFAAKAQRDESAQSRLDLWANCWDSMQRRPLFGVGPDQWTTAVMEYGWYRGKQAHTLWLQIGAELGLPGLACLLLFYLLCIVRLWPIARGRGEVSDPWLRSMARMVIASLVGFMVAVQFVSFSGLEVSYYVALIGAGGLKLLSTQTQQSASEPAPEEESLSEETNDLARADAPVPSF